MRKFRHNTRGQFVVVAALLIALLTLSVALSIHQVNLHRQQLRYEPVEELVLGITSDLDRCLTHALSIATQQYQNNRSYGVGYATNKGYDFISKWVRSILASYSHLGIKMTMSVPPNKTQGGPTDVGWLISWDNPVGVSWVFTKFDLDIDAYGFKGWVGRSAKFVRLEILPQSIQLGNQSTTLEFKILQGKLSDTLTLPIPNLTPESLKKTRVHIIDNFWVSDPELKVTALRYLGEGTYNVTFNQRINKHTLGVKLTVDTPEDNIVVSALYYRNVNVFINLQSQEEKSPVPTNKGLIEFDGLNYTLPVSLSTSPGTYLMKYFPEGRDTFLNWTTTENIHVTNPDFFKTWVTIDGDGNVTAFYRGGYNPPQPTIVNLTLDSREWNNQTQHLGNITLGSTSYTLPNTIVILAGDYTLQYEPCNSSYFFIEWETSGDVIPASTVSNPTTLRVIGNGTVIAVYGSAPTTPPTPTLANVTLQSMDENSSAPANLGKIQFGGTLFKLPNSTTVLSGIYLLEYFPEEGYTFINWTTTENINVQNLNSRITSATVKGNGTITAFYRRGITPELKTVNLILDSREWNNLTRHLGSITLGATNYNLPANVNLTVGDYPIQYIPEKGYIFQRWEFSGDVILASTVGNPTTLTIYGNATVIAVYGSLPPITAPVSVTLQSLEETLAPPGNLGKIQLGATLYGLPNSTTVLSGTYLLEYFPEEGYTFINWTTTENINVQNSTSSLTTVTINGNGTITAFYRGCKVYLDSRQWDYSSFHLGYITLGATTYALPKNLTGVACGDYLLRYTPENSSYVFLWWNWTGKVIPDNRTSATTTLTIYGDGNVTAVYSLSYRPPPSLPGEWGTLYLGKLGPDSMLLPYFMLPDSYFTPRASTLPIPPRPSWQYIDVNSPPVPFDITLAKLVNVTLYIQLASGKAENISLVLSFTYNEVKYILGFHTYYDLVGESWYSFSINTEEIDKTSWPMPDQAIIPEGSVITLTVIVPPNSGTIHIIYGWDNYQSRIELF